MRNLAQLAQRSNYAAHKDRTRKAQAQQSQVGRDIAPLPSVVDPKRRARADKSYLAFCSIYLAATFYLPWSIDQEKVAARIETAVRNGGLFAMAMPRGSGKTCLAEAGALWAVLTGRHPFVALIGASEPAAGEMLETIKVQLECNDLLLADFPEICYPIRKLEGIAQRAHGQLFQGRRTHIGWTAHHVRLPALPDAPGGGAIIRVAGLTGRVRGMKHTRPDGQSVRPSLVILDDPQTDESARSPSQTQTRRSIINGAILGLAGPGRKIAALMPCTVIEADDLSDQLLDRKRNPLWQGERMKMVYRFPSNTKRWDQYAEILAAELQAGGHGAAATDFYRLHRKAMDRGARVAWPDRYNADELSALQNAMNLRIRDEAAFFAECQNDPIQSETEGVEIPTAASIAAKCNGLARGRLPTEAEFLTLFVDVHDKLLYWLLAAWSPAMRGWVVDYNTYPDQRRHYFTMRQATRTLRRAHKGTDVDGAIFAGLVALLDGDLLNREWSRKDGAEITLTRCLIDVGYKPDVITEYIRQSPGRALLFPSRGQGIKAGQRPICDYDRKRGDRIGHNWWIPKATKRRADRHIRIDTNSWKTFCMEGLAAARGSRRSIDLYGHKPERHRLLADHLTAETATETAGHGRTVNEFSEIPGRDNHWLDGLVGAAVAASLHGAKPTATAARPLNKPSTPTRRPRRKRVSYLN